MSLPVILAFHSVGDGPKPLSIPRSVFARQIAGLRDAGCTALTVSGLTARMARFPRARRQRRRAARPRGALVRVGSSITGLLSSRSSSRAIPLAPPGAGRRGGGNTARRDRGPRHPRLRGRLEQIEAR